MKDPTESVILCEGYHDRAFWKGWLEFLGCTDARQMHHGKLSSARDPFGKPVSKGQFGFHTPAKAFVRVRPCDGDNGVLETLSVRLEERKTQGLCRLIVNLDTDAKDDAEDTTREESLRQRIKSRVNKADPCWKELENGDLALDDAATVVSIVLWSAEEATSPLLPAKQTLERLVCAALSSVYPPRADAIAAWLVSRPSPPPASPKEHAWSHMAGWYGAQGCDEFYQNIWRDKDVANELRRRLQSSDAWRPIEALLAQGRTAGRPSTG